MPRGRALGMVMQLPEGDQTSMTRKQMLARLDVCMGGRLAEEVTIKLKTVDKYFECALVIFQIIFGEDEVTSGAVSDIQQVSLYACVNIIC